MPVQDDDLQAPAAADALAETSPLPTLTVFSDFVRDVVVVSATNTSLLTCIGRLGDGADNEVVVPFVEVKFEGPEPLDGGVPPAFFSQILTLDNAAFLIADLAQDFGGVCEHLRKMSTGEVKAERARLDYVRRYLTDAQAHIAQSLATIEAISGYPADPAPRKDTPPRDGLSY
jgi:hypothetical protein